MTATGQRQLAVRVDDETLVAIDRKRMEIAAQMGEIPTRSEVVRFALDAYLNAPEKPSRKNPGK